MVDATFIFVLLFGGALVGLVSGLVRRRGSAGASIEVVAGAVFGWIGPGLLMHVPGVSQAMLAALRRFGVDEQSAALAGSDVVYLSPVIGGFVGVAAVSLVRLMKGERRPVSWGFATGEILKIVGYVMLTISLSLVVGLVVLLLFLPAPTGTESMWMPMLLELLPWIALILAGNGLMRWCAGSA